MLIPTPRSMTVFDNALPPSTAFAVLVDKETDARVVAHADRLQTELAVKGSYPVFISHGNAADEGYTLTIDGAGVLIHGNSAAGAFYGIQTLRQLLKIHGTALPYCHIEDAPALRERGFYHDISRGRVPTLTQLCRMVDRLSELKINQLQLYMENTIALPPYDRITAEDDRLTAEEIMALDAYCRDRFVELVPSLSTFGHLYDLLESAPYRHLCEMENYHPTRAYWIEKMLHHTIDVSNDESIALIGDMIDRLVPLFSSDRFNICCDETFDLCKGRNIGKDAGDEYFKFLLKIIDRVRAHGKTVMMWGDIALNHPDKLHLLPPDTVLLNWDYEKHPNEDKVRTLAERGLPQLVCPGTSGWNSFVEQTDIAFSNIITLAAYGKAHHARGILNTNWGDYGSICPFNAVLFSTALGAEMGWSESTALSPIFEQTASRLLYDSDVNVVALIRRMEHCQCVCNWHRLVHWHSENRIEHRATSLACDTARAIAAIAEIDDVAAQLRAISSTDERINDLVLACRGIRLVLHVCLHVNNADGFSDDAALHTEADAWLREYHAAWLRDNKESGFWRIETFLHDVIRHRTW